MQDETTLWLWKNGDHYLAFEHLYPCFTPGGDPMTLGEPFGRAVFKVSHDRATPPADRAAQPVERTRRLVDAAMRVISKHDAWARQMPAGKFDDPLGDAVAALHEATEDQGIALDIASQPADPSAQEAKRLADEAVGLAYFGKHERIAALSALHAAIDALASQGRAAVTGAANQRAPLWSMTTPTSPDDHHQDAPPQASPRL